MISKDKPQFAADSLATMVKFKGDYDLAIAHRD